MIEGGSLGRALLLGQNFCDYGSFTSSRVGDRAAVSISVGADPNSPSAQFKDDPDVPNEDALSIIEAGDWAGYAVADAHYGPESSHMLIERLHTLWSKIRPEGIDHLGQMMSFLRNGDAPRTGSETTLLAVVLDRQTRQGFGISFGDSTVMAVGRSGARRLNSRDSRYVTAADRSLLEPGRAFRFDVDAGEMLLVFTDGIDECHYRRPETSVGQRHIEAVIDRAEGDPLAVVDGLTTLALTGVEGNPGGQDNIAAIAARA